VGAIVESQLQVNAIRKLAVAGEQAGFTLDQMIELLNAGMTVVALLDVITWRLDPSQFSRDGFPVGLGRAIWHSREVANDYS
jgi:hypothetical protein